MSRKSFEHIKLKSSNSEPQQNFKHEDFAAGIAPNLRGSSATMYVRKPWKIRQHIGFSSVEESNTFFRKNIKSGQKELFVTFDLTAHKGIDSVEDMKVLFDEIPLDEISISLKINKTVLPILAFYIVASEEKGIALDQLSGTFQDDILTEFICKNEENYTPSPSKKIIADIFEFTNNKMPKFNSISIAGYSLKETGASAEIELANTLANGLEYIKKGIKSGMNIDSITEKLSFSWAIGMNHFTEIAKLRAARMLWAKIVKQFNPKNQNSLTLRIHCQTSESSLTTQDPFNNVARTTIEAMAAAFGGTQSLQTNAIDEAFTLPTVSERIARNTQLHLQQETHITKIVDPWGGSFHVEKLTEEIANKTWQFIKEIEDLGGMTKAIEKRIPKIKIEEAATKKQARFDSRVDTIIGVYKYQLKQEDTLPILDADNETIVKSQIEKLKLLKASRNNTEVKKSLENLTNAAKSGEENLLDLTIKAAKNSATLSEISDALKVTFSRH